MQNALLTEKKKSVYKVDFLEKNMTEKYVAKPLADELEKLGVHITRATKIVNAGRKTLSITKDGKVINLPVEIRKVMNKNNLIEIEIRATGNTEGELIDNLKEIKKTLSVWQIKPKECVWSQGSWKEETQIKSDVNEAEMETELKRLRLIVQDQTSELAKLKDIQIKKSMREDRNVMKGILS